MTILPSKKDRNSSKNGVNGNEKDYHGHSNHGHHNYHHSSPPRWSRTERGTSNVVNNVLNESNSDSSKRSSSDNDETSVHSIDSGPSHGSKRRQRENRYNNLGYSSTRSKASPNSGSNSLSSGSAAEINLEMTPTTSSVELNGSSRVSSDSDNQESENEVPLLVSVSDDMVSVQGYNSGDEYDKSLKWSAEELEKMESRFEKKMRKKGFIIKKMGEDGACLFRAVADQVYGDQEMHQSVRKLCMDYIAKNADYFSQYVTEDFKNYIERKSMDHSHGNHVEIQALSEMYNRPIEVYHYSSTPINIFQGCQETDNEPIRLSYHQNIHYNSLVNPLKATVGVGLGLPAYKPGLAEKNLLDNAIRASEDHELEKAMLEDKLRATDWEATNEAIEEQVARESYVEWLRENEKRAMKKKSKLTATATSTSNQTPLSQSPSRSSPKASSSGTSNGNSPIARESSLIETASFVNQFPPQFFGKNQNFQTSDMIRLH